MSHRGLEARLRRMERASGIGAPRETGPLLVLVEVDDAGQGRIGGVIGPWRDCPSRGWPPDAYEPFCGDALELDDYYARCGWAPQRTIIGAREGPGESLFFKRQHEQQR